MDLGNPIAWQPAPADLDRLDRLADRYGLSAACACRLACALLAEHAATCVPLPAPEEGQRTISSRASFRPAASTRSALVYVQAVTDLDSHRAISAGLALVEQILKVNDVGAGDAPTRPAPTVSP